MPGQKKYHTDHADPLVRRLEEIRQCLRCSQSRMAENIGVPFRTYQKWIYLGQKPRHGAALLARAEGLMPRNRVNCWEILKCGREPGGSQVQALGVCPAALEMGANGLNSGLNGGRICWAVSGTFCGRQAEGSEAIRFISCLGCDFFARVLKEEGLANFSLLRPGQTFTQP